MSQVRFGLQLWSQSASWPEYREAALAAEAAGWDSIWTWDHLLAIQGPWQQPIFEGWELLTAIAVVTKRVRVGLMVGANTFRNPGVTAKLATTLDHVSSGRAVLGIGGAWFEREHEAFGIDFGTSVGERLDRARGGGAAAAAPVRRRAGDATRAGSTRSRTRYASHRRSSRTCRSSSAAAARRRRSGRLPATRTHGTRAATSKP